LDPIRVGWVSVAAEDMGVWLDRISRAEGFDSRILVDELRVALGANRGRKLGAQLGRVHDIVSGRVRPEVALIALERISMARHVAFLTGDTELHRFREAALSMPSHI